MPTTRGFFDSAQASGRRPGATRGRPTFGSPSQGITEASSFAFLDRIGDFAENAGDIINAVKGTTNDTTATKPAETVNTPASNQANAAAQNSSSLLGGLNPKIVWIVGAVILVALFLHFKK